MSTNHQTFASTYVSRRFSACDQDSHCGFFSPRSIFFSRPGCLGLLMKKSC